MALESGPEADRGAETSRGLAGTVRSNSRGRKEALSQDA